MGDEVVPYRIDVAEAELDDLRDRLRRTRWPEAETVTDWSQGTPLAYLQEVCAYWADGYDWRRCEARLNELPQVRTEIDGLGFHALHVRSPHDGALPLVLTHGWPGSIIEFAKVIGPLTDPTAHGGDAADAFHVVCPSLPGFGFSDKPAEHGWNVERIADAWDVLMARLGYDRYGAQGGDWGSSVTGRIARAPSRPLRRHPPEHGGRPPGPRRHDRPDRAGAGRAGRVPALPGLGLGLLQAAVDPAPDAWATASSTRRRARPGGSWRSSGPGPTATAIPRTPSPVTSCSTTSCSTGSPAPAPRRPGIYWESFGTFRGDPVDVPTGVAMFPKEIFRPTRAWAEKQYRDIRQWNELDKGGHFAAFEQPEVFVDEVRSFFRQVR